MCSQVCHGEMVVPSELFEQIAPRITKSNMEETTPAIQYHYIEHLEPPTRRRRLTICLQKLEEYGIPHWRLKFTGYMSRAVDASLEMLSPQKTEFDVVPCGFTKNVTNLEGEVFYDALCEKSD